LYIRFLYTNFININTQGISKNIYIKQQVN
jgi:hypothetical protein